MRLERLPVADEVVVEGEVVVLVGGEVVLLSPIASRLLLLVGDGRPAADDVRDRLFEEFGEPEDPREAWDLVVRMLVSLGLLALVGAEA